MYISKGSVPSAPAMLSPEFLIIVFAIRIVLLMHSIFSRDDTKLPIVLNYLIATAIFPHSIGISK